jgi:hypothetical protein
VDPRAFADVHELSAQAAIERRLDEGVVHDDVGGLEEALAADGDEIDGARTCTDEVDLADAP